MSTINPAYNDRVKYTLSYRPYGTQIIQDPIGWETDDKEIDRNEEYHGIFTKFSNNLTFVGNGADFIIAVDDMYDVNADIRLTKHVKHPQTDLWILSYYGYLDLSTLEKEDGRVKVKFNSGGLEQLIKSRESEAVEIERLTTIDGAPMDPLRIDTVLLTGRQILLNSLFDIQETDNAASIYLGAGSISGGADRAQSVGVPLNLYSKSHEEAQSILPQTTAGESQGTTGIMFFAVTQVIRTLRIKIDLTFTSNIYEKDDINHAFWGLFIGKYGGGTGYSLISRTTLFHSDNIGGYDYLGGTAYGNPFTGVNNNPPRQWQVTWEGDITLNPGESLSLEFYGKANLGSSFHDGHFAVIAQNISGSLKIVEDSFYEASKSKFILAYEMANRLLEIMTGRKTALKSDFFGRTDIGYAQDGKAALNGFTHGFWVRGFDAEQEDTEDVPNSFKPLTTSWKDFIGSMQSIWNVGLGIETQGYNERVVIEDLSYFYSSQVTVRLPNPILKAKETKAVKYYYSGIDIGYAKGGQYQEAMGLDEYNGKSTFTTVINRLKNVYSKLSMYRADSYGKEFARRKPKVNYPTQDTTYDNDIFVMDLKRNPDGSQIFLERVWQDDFAQAPTGTYSPNTATNLRLSPFNMLLRHGWVIAAGLTKYLSDYIRYGSSSANSGLTTRLIGGNEYAENGNVIVSELPRARYVAKFKEFEHQVDTELMQQIEGTTQVNGRTIPNMYGLIEYTNENGEIERGYLINLKPNDGKFKVLISNR